MAFEFRSDVLQVLDNLQSQVDSTRRQKQRTHRAVSPRGTSTPTQGTPSRPDILASPATTTTSFLRSSTPSRGATGIRSGSARTSSRASTPPPQTQVNPVPTTRFESLLSAVAAGMVQQAQLPSRAPPRQSAQFHLDREPRQHTPEPPAPLQTHTTLFSAVNPESTKPWQRPTEQKAKAPKPLLPTDITLGPSCVLRVFSATGIGCQSITQTIAGVGVAPSNSNTARNSSRPQSAAAVWCTNTQREKAATCVLELSLKALYGEGNDAISAAHDALLYFVSDNALPTISRCIVGTSPHPNAGWQIVADQPCPAPQRSVDPLCRQAVLIDSTRLHKYMQLTLAPEPGSGHNTRVVFLTVTLSPTQRRIPPPALRRQSFSGPSLSTPQRALIQRQNVESIQLAPAPVYSGDEVDEEDAQLDVCAGCNGVIDGDVTTALDKKWHPRCFTCAACSREIKAQKFTVQGQGVYHLECRPVSTALLVLDQKSATAALSVRQATAEGAGQQPQQPMRQLIQSHLRLSDEQHLQDIRDKLLLKLQQKQLQTTAPLTGSPGSGTPTAAPATPNERSGAAANVLFLGSTPDSPPPAPKSAVPQPFQQPAPAPAVKQPVTPTENHKSPLKHLGPQSHFSEASVNPIAAKSPPSPVAQNEITGSHNVSHLHTSPLSLEAAFRGVGPMDSPQRSRRFKKRRSHTTHRQHGDTTYTTDSDTDESVPQHHPPMMVIPEAPTDRQPRQVQAERYPQPTQIYSPRQPVETLSPPLIGPGRSATGSHQRSASQPAPSTGGPAGLRDTVRGNTPKKSENGLPEPSRQNPPPRKCSTPLPREELRIDTASVAAIQSGKAVARNPPSVENALQLHSSPAPPQPLGLPPRPVATKLSDVGTIQPRRRSEQMPHRADEFAIPGNSGHSPTIKASAADFRPSHTFAIKPDQATPRIGPGGNRTSPDISHHGIIAARPPSRSSDPGLGPPSSARKQSWEAEPIGTLSPRSSSAPPPGLAQLAVAWEAASHKDQGATTSPFSVAVPSSSGSLLKYLHPQPGNDRHNPRSPEASFASPLRDFGSAKKVQDIPTLWKPSPKQSQPMAADESESQSDDTELRPATAAGTVLSRKQAKRMQKKQLKRALKAQNKASERADAALHIHLTTQPLSPDRDVARTDASVGAESPGEGLSHHRLVWSQLRSIVQQVHQTPNGSAPTRVVFYPNTNFGSLARVFSMPRYSVFLLTDFYVHFEQTSSLADRKRECVELLEHYMPADIELSEVSSISSCTLFCLRKRNGGVSGSEKWILLHYEHPLEVIRRYVRHCRTWLRLHCFLDFENSLFEQLITEVVDLAGETTEALSGNRSEPSLLYYTDHLHVFAPFFGDEFRQHPLQGFTYQGLRFAGHMEGRHGFLRLTVTRHTPEHYLWRRSAMAVYQQFRIEVGDIDVHLHFINLADYLNQFDATGIPFSALLLSRRCNTMLTRLLSPDLLHAVTERVHFVGSDFFKPKAAGGNSGTSALQLLNIADQYRCESVATTAFGEGEHDRMMDEIYVWTGRFPKQIHVFYMEPSDFSDIRPHFELVA
eukprot:TRINITY_DN9975_c0_g1_i1.p1 TRINITY_DN9975_c0_g1~~TRINITY_DN9975_c0_g1_i1.p1  ORF type:complete len:1553 (-),score=149.75 TRINITY_DN9975_c0_g1_i1:15-4673(-)